MGENDLSGQYDITLSATIAGVISEEGAATATRVASEEAAARAAAEAEALEMLLISMGYTDFGAEWEEWEEEEEGEYEYVSWHQEASLSDAVILAPEAGSQAWRKLFTAPSLRLSERPGQLARNARLLKSRLQRKRHLQKIEEKNLESGQKNHWHYLPICGCSEKALQPWRNKGWTTLCIDS